jgi:hypothetical protein
MLLFHHLRLRLPNGVFPSGFCTKHVYTFFISPIHVAWLTNFTFLHLTREMGWTMNLSSQSKRVPILFMTR